MIYKKPAMGKGDSKLAALIGSWLGFNGLFLSIWLAFFFAGIFALLGLISKKINKDQKIPFQHSEKLERLNTNVKLITIENGLHMNLDDFKEYRDELTLILKNFR